MSYDFNDFNIYKGGRYEIYFKDIHLNRIKPDKYVYHSTHPNNYKSIMEHGLLLRTNNTWESELHYPLSIFAMNGVDTEKIELWNKGSDVWRIDTTHLPNKWYNDLNIPSYKRKGPIMTFEPIGIEYLKYMNENDGEIPM